MGLNELQPALTIEQQIQHIKSRVINHLAIQYGPIGYRDRENFLDSMQQDRSTGSEVSSII